VYTAIFVGQLAVGASLFHGNLRVVNKLASVPLPPRHSDNHDHHSQNQQSAEHNGNCFGNAGPS
jgi:hypothetical protein